MHQLNPRSACKAIMPSSYHSRPTVNISFITSKVTTRLSTVTSFKLVVDENLHLCKN